MLDLGQEAGAFGTTNDLSSGFQEVPSTEELMNAFDAIVGGSPNFMSKTATHHTLLLLCFLALYIYIVLTVHSYAGSRRFGGA